MLMGIRTGTARDHSALVELQRRTSLLAYAPMFPPDQFPFPLEATRVHWRNILASDEEDVFVVEEASGRIVGAVAVKNGAELHSLFVDPERWRTGIGSALLSAAVRHMRERGQSWARLWVMRENKGARLFYERHGWSPDGRQDVSSFPPHPLLLGYELSLRENQGPPSLRFSRRAP
jgi:ribosomal protein S18 acetylase RimI-like enzyme